MLLVKCEARPSPIHGLGLFAGEDIKAGAAVARWTEGVDYRLTVEEFKALPVELRTFLWIFVWTWIDGLIYGTADAGRFTNRSKTPNMRWDDETRTSYAINDIAAGTELTEDYDEFDHSAEMPGSAAPVPVVTPGEPRGWSECCHGVTLRFACSLCTEMTADVDIRCVNNPGAGTCCDEMCAGHESGWCATCPCCRLPKISSRAHAPPVTPAPAPQRSPIDELSDLLHAAGVRPYMKQRDPADPTKCVHGNPMGPFCAACVPAAPAPAVVPATCGICLEGRYCRAPFEPCVPCPLPKGHAATNDCRGAR